MSRRKLRPAPAQGIGARIRIAREALGWSQFQLGRAVGVSRSAVSQWEKGAVQNLRLGNLFATADALGQDVRHLVFGDRAGVAEGRAPEYAGMDSGSQELLRTWDALPREVQAHLRGLLLALARAQEDAPRE